VIGAEAGGGERALDLLDGAVAARDPAASQQRALAILLDQAAAAAGHAPVRGAGHQIRLETAQTQHLPGEIDDVA
jgi:hypothetical protein